jgi:RHS repeat-associated protein
LHSDHQGSIIAHSNASGSHLAALSYDAYGIPKSTNSDRFGFTGQAWLKELGLYHYKARMYSPRLGRFLQTDPIGYADNMNMYAYVGNDPVNKIDPTGMITQTGMQSFSNIAAMQNAMRNMTTAQYLNMLEHQANSASAALSDASDYLTGVAITASAFDGGEAVAFVAGVGASMASLGAGALKVEPGSFSIAFAAEVTAGSVSKKIEPLIDILGIAKTLTDEAYKKISNVTSEISGAAAGLATSDAMENAKSNRAENGMSGSVVKICSGMGAQSDGCRD